VRKMETEWIRSRRGRAEATTTGTCRLPLATACRVHRIPNRLRASAPPAFAEKVRGRTGSAGWRRKTPARHQMVRVRRYGIECGGRGLLLSNACANLLDRAGKRSDVFDHTGLYTHSVTY
jgi:hypothetical protein